MRYLILNADDFGLTAGVTDGVIEAHQRGLLTSTTLLVGAPDATRAARLARGFSRLGTGLHLALSAVRPILPPHRIGTLVDADGRFPYSFLGVAARLSMGRINLTELEQELEAQILAMQDLGLTITHLDGHNHLHVHPTVLPIVLRLMARHHIGALRLPRAAPPLEAADLQPASRRQTLKGYLLRVATRHATARIQQAGVATTDHFIGFEQSGHLTGERLRTVLSQLPPGITEVMLHPARMDVELTTRHAWGYDWEEELQGLLDPGVAACVQSHAITLIHYGTLPGVGELNARSRSS